MVAHLLAAIPTVGSLASRRPDSVSPAGPPQLAATPLPAACAKLERRRALFPCAARVEQSASLQRALIASAQVGLLLLLT